MMYAGAFLAVLTVAIGLALIAPQPVLAGPVEDEVSGARDPSEPRVFEHVPICYGVDVEVIGVEEAGCPPPDFPPICYCVEKADCFPPDILPFVEKADRFRSGSRPICCFPPDILPIVEKADRFPPICYCVEKAGCSPPDFPPVGIR